MVDYTKFADDYAESWKNFHIKDIEGKSWLSDAEKQQEKENAIKQNEFQKQENRAISKILEKEGPDFFRKSEYDQEKILSEALLKEGILKVKQFEDGSGSYTTYADGFHSYPPANEKYELAKRAGNIVVSGAFNIAEKSRDDPLNANGDFELGKLRREFNNQTSVSAMHGVAMKYIEKQAENPRTFTANSVNLTAQISEEAKGKTSASKDEFEGMLAERVKDLDKIKEFSNNPNQRYYGNGLMATREPTTNAVTYTVDGQTIDKDNFNKLYQAKEFAKRDDKLTDAVQYGSLICLYDAESKGSNNQYSNKKWLAKDENGALREVSQDEAGQIHAFEKASGKDVEAKAMKVENYGGGLIHMKDQNGNSSYLNAGNLKNPNTGISRNMVKTQIISQSKEGGRL
jgi:hypothetical protein